MTDQHTLYDFDARLLTGEEAHLADHRGKVVVVVNTASKCGFTPQFEELEQLYRAHGDEGLVVLGFPCNQFAHQDPGTAAEIGEFCQLNYGVSFPMFEKVDVNGEHAHPLFRWLKEQKGGLLGGAIKWNFTKFLIGRDGRVIERYAPTTKPSEMEADIVAALAAPAPTAA